MTLLEELLRWPDDKVFPAIDLCKLLLLRSGMQAHAPALVSQVLDVAEKMVRAALTHTMNGRSISTCIRVAPVRNIYVRGITSGLLVRGAHDCCLVCLVKGTKLPNGSYAIAEKVRYANTRLALEFMANCVATGTAADAVIALVIPATTLFFPPLAELSSFRAAD